ncbi:sugar MFS transporter, partial [Burkholderia cepacia]|nr:sugar MFS transporter [Burkholderia cepacia]
VVLIIISGLLAMLKLPKIAHVESENEDLTGRAYHYRHLVFGVLGIFAYVGGEVAIGSHIVSYLHLPDVMSLPPKVAGDKVAWYWGGAMVGRFLGAYLLNKFNPGRLLAFNALGAVILVLISVSSTGAVAMWSLLAVGLMNSIM